MPSLGLIGEINASKQYEWKIADFFSLSTINGFRYNSPSFTLGNTSWHLHIYPAGAPMVSPGIISLFLVNESDIPRRVSLVFRIKRADGTLFGNASSNHFIIKSVGCMSFYERSVLQQNAFDLVPSGILTIICTLKIDQDEKHSTIKDKKLEKLREKQGHGTIDHKIFAELDRLSENFKSIFINKDNCDTTLNVMGKEYKAHRAVLIARSSVFAAMFQHETTEKQTGIINISDCDPESFEEFLKFLYSGKLEEPSARSALHLYETSDKYDVLELKPFCVECLMESIRVENVCDIVIMADKYEETNLLNAAQEFFNKNRDEIFDTSEWYSLVQNNYRLSIKLLKGMSSKMKLVE